MTKSPWARVLLLASVLLFAGCAGTFTLENTVQSFTQVTTLPPPATFRFDQLPSQRTPAGMQMQAMAEGALRQAGLQRDDVHPRYSVQVGARVQQVLSPWAAPYAGWGWGPGWGWRRHGWMGADLDQRWFERDVSIVIRDLQADGKVVYETHAHSDGPWLDNGPILPAMFQAAMQGFPNPPPGPRQINVQLAG